MILEFVNTERSKYYHRMMFISQILCKLSKIIYTRDPFEWIK